MSGECNICGEWGCTESRHEHTSDGMTLKDSGARQTWETGSRRDTRDGKGRFDLLPWDIVWADAKYIELGAKKYGDRNWEKGQPLSRYLDSACRHLAKYMAGQRDEPHLLACRWNIAAYLWTLSRIKEGVLPVSLDDLGESQKPPMDTNG
jgi:hypothetical protein